MSSQWPKWMQHITERWPSWPTTIFGYITEQVKLILKQMPWPECMHGNSGTYLQVMAAAMWAMKEAALIGPTKFIEAYSCNLHILDSIQDSKQVTCMVIEDWHQAQQADPTLNLVIARLRDGTLGWWQLKQNDPTKLSQFLLEWNHLQLWRDAMHRGARLKESEETLFSWFCHMHRQRLL